MNQLTRAVSRIIEFSKRIGARRVQDGGAGDEVAPFAIEDLPELPYGSWPSAVSRLSRHLLAWLKDRDGRKPFITDRGSSSVISPLEILSWSEISDPDALLAVWLWHVKASEGMPRGVIMTLWPHPRSLSHVIPILSLPDCAMMPLIEAMKNAWNLHEATTVGHYLDLTTWYREFEDAVGVMLISGVADT